MSRPRRSTRSKPQVDAMEQRLVLSQAAAAPIAQAIVQRPPAMLQRLNALPQTQTQAQTNVRPQILADVQTHRRVAANQEPGGRDAQAAHREANRLQTEQRREQARERRERRQQADAAPAPTTTPSTSTYKIHADSSDNGFSFKKIWKSLFSW